MIGIIGFLLTILSFFAQEMPFSLFTEIEETANGAAGLKN